MGFDIEGIHNGEKDFEIERHWSLEFLPNSITIEEIYTGNFQSDLAKYLAWAQAEYLKPKCCRDQSETVRLVFVWFLETLKKSHDLENFQDRFRQKLREINLMAEQKLAIEGVFNLKFSSVFILIGSGIMSMCQKYAEYKLKMKRPPKYI